MVGIENKVSFADLLRWSIDQGVLSAPCHLGSDVDLRPIAHEILAELSSQVLLVPGDYFAAKRADLIIGSLVKPVEDRVRTRDDGASETIDCLISEFRMLLESALDVGIDFRTGFDAPIHRDFDLSYFCEWEAGGVSPPDWAFDYFDGDGTS
ncbi:MAG: hypothetical protein QOD39_1103 [Mycobacterium sp.]|jgi:hypothetical protein|nr:hypothetical protein [Mycobacterium sp.]